jgi:crotonobetainyl-CoA:carnitine CoA-transferase CaiB-like acyl-CoA transferase
MQAEAGYLTLCGEPDSPPARFGLSLVDYMSGQNMALGLVSAVLKARETGQGRNIDVSLYDTAVFNLSYLAAWAMNTEYEPDRAPRSAHPSVVPCQLYRTADGWIFIMCNKPDFWPVLCELIGRPELANDDRFVDFDTRLKHRDALTEILDGTLSTQSTSHWMGLFAGRIPAAPVLTPKAALASEFFAERQLSQTLTASQGDAFKVLAQPIQTGDDRSDDRAAPVMGQDTDDLLADLGYSPETIAQMRNAGTV